MCAHTQKSTQIWSSESKFCKGRLGESKSEIWTLSPKRPLQMVRGVPVKPLKVASKSLKPTPKVTVLTKIVALGVGVSFLHRGSV